MMTAMHLGEYAFVHRCIYVLPLPGGVVHSINVERVRIFYKNFM